jgi:hypothetical protein
MFLCGSYLQNQTSYRGQAWIKNHLLFSSFPTVRQSTADVKVLVLSFPLKKAGFLFSGAIRAGKKAHNLPAVDIYVT